MSRKRYTYETSLNWGGDIPTCELDCVVSYAVKPGRPATGPTYESGGDPAEDPEIEDIQVVSIDGKPVTAIDNDTVEAILARMDDMWEALLENACE